MASETFLVLGFLPDNRDLERDGVHTPLRSDGYYARPEMPTQVANLWRRKRLHPMERIVVVQIVNDDDDHATGGDNGL